MVHGVVAEMMRTALPSWASLMRVSFSSCFVTIPSGVSDLNNGSSEAEGWFIVEDSFYWC